MTTTPCYGDDSFVVLDGGERGTIIDFYPKALKWSKGFIFPKKSGMASWVWFTTWLLI